MRRTATLFAILISPVLLSCGGDEPVCETREAALQEQRWILECEVSAGAPAVSRVASYFDPEWTDELPSSVHIYCSDRGPTFAWNPGVRTADPSDRWREKTVVHRVDGGRRVQSRWMVSTDEGARPTYHLFGSQAAAFIGALREARELLLETSIDQDEDPTLRLVTLVGLRAALEPIPCLSED